ncbi:MAG: hypothetical protein ACOCSL_01580 [Thermoplasmatota archaeon]
MEIDLKRLFYPSLCYHGLKKLGFTGENPEKEYLEKSKKLSDMGDDFSFSAPVAGDPLFTFVYQIPSYLEPENTEEYLEIMEKVKKMIFKKNVEDFKKDWPGKTKYWDEWYTDCLKNYIFQDIGGKEEKVNNIIDEFTEYLVDIWDGYLRIYENKFQNYPFDELQANIDNLEVEKIWDDEFGWNYPYDRFDLIVCPETKSTASSLGPEKVVFSTDYHWEIMKNSVIHEIGVRYFDLSELCKDDRTHEYMYDDYVGMLRLIETEVCYRKKKIMPNLRKDSFVKGMRLEKLVEWRGKREFGDDMIETMSEFYGDAKDNDLI